MSTRRDSLVFPNPQQESMQMTKVEKQSRKSVVVPVVLAVLVVAGVVVVPLTAQTPALGDATASATATITTPAATPVRTAGWTDRTPIARCGTAGTTRSDAGMTCMGTTDSSTPIGTFSPIEATSPETTSWSFGFELTASAMRTETSAATRRA